MRRYVIPLLIVTIGMVGFVATSGSASSCTRTGTPQRDVMRGTDSRDVLCSIGGNDFIHGAGGNDVLRGGANRDTLIGAGGRDVLKGQAGKDQLFAVDDRGGERLYGGPGRDQCYGDAGDSFFGCEVRRIGVSLPVVDGLEHALFVVAGDALAVVTTIIPTPPVVTQVVTVTKTVPFPACEPPPNVLPPIC